MPPARPRARSDPRARAGSDPRARARSDPRARARSDPRARARSDPRARAGSDPRARARRRAEAGQASVELVAVVPALLVAGWLAWQLALAGHALWASANAARVGARAQHVGGDARAAALGALPARLREGARVEAAGARTRVRVPLRVGLPGARPLRTWIDASAALPGGGEP